MGQRLTITESERNRIKGLYENNMDMKDGGLSKRPFDRMVMDCLKSEGFVIENTNGKYEFSMSKRETGQGTYDYIIRSTENPASFTTYVVADGKLERNGFLSIGTTTNCKTIVDTVYGRINVQRNNQISNFKR
jgi:hypothetical protein